MKTLVSTLACSGLLFSLCGCSEQSPTTSQAPDAHEHEHEHEHDHDGKGGGIQPAVAPSAAGQKYVLAEAPSEFQNVIAARETAKNDDEVVLFGQIGGSLNPWIEDRAAFTIVDDSLQSCDQIEGDSCPTPWDYCCATPKLKTATALVKVIDETGTVVKTDARELLGVRELTSVIVSGKAERDDAGNLTVLATGIFVRK